MLETLLDDLVPPAMERLGVPGVAVACVDGSHRDVYCHGIDVHAGGGRPVDRSTRFDLEGLTKPFTASAVISLARARALDLDAPLGERLGLVGADTESRAISPRQLLAHHAGLGDDCRALVRAGSLRHEAGHLLALPRIMPPGLAYSYSNVGYAVLGALVEHLTGLTFDDALRKLVLQPLGVRAELVQGELLRPAIGLRMSAEEMATVLRAQLDQTDQLRAMWEPVGPADGQFSIGCGWFSRAAGDKTVVQHGGGGLGSGSLVMVVPEDGFGIAVLTSSDSGNRLKLDVTREVLHHHLGILPVDPVILDDPRDPSLYAGHYEDAQRRIDVWGEGSRLHARVETRPSAWPFWTPVPETYSCVLGFYAPDRAVELSGPAEAAGREFGHEFIRHGGRPTWIRMNSRAARRRG